MLLLLLWNVPAKQLLHTASAVAVHVCATYRPAPQPATHALHAVAVCAPSF